MFAVDRNKKLRLFRDKVQRATSGAPSGLRNPHLETMRHSSECEISFHNKYLKEFFFKDVSNFALLENATWRPTLDRTSIDLGYTNKLYNLRWGDTGVEEK